MDSVVLGDDFLRLDNGWLVWDQIDFDMLKPLRVFCSFRQ